MSAKKTAQALKGTTFTDLFDLPAQVDPPRLNPINREEFNENIAAVALGVLYDILMDPNEKGYVKIEAAKELMNRAEGKPMSKTSTGDLDADQMNDLLPVVVRRKKPEDTSIQSECSEVTE